MTMVFRSPYSTRPIDVKDDDKFVFIVVASAGYADDWAAYQLPLGEHQGMVNELPLQEALEHCAEHGDKLPQAAAEALFPVMKRTGRVYRE